MVYRAYCPHAAEPVAEKSAGQGLLAPVPKPTLVGEERILRRSREPPLRNSANWVRNFGIWTARLSSELVEEQRWVAVKRPGRLFTKNTGLCKGASLRIQTDACSMP